MNYNVNNNFDFTEKGDLEKIESILEMDIPLLIHMDEERYISPSKYDCTVVHLENNVYESFVGRALLTQDDIVIFKPPSWYTKLEEKCKKEPDKNHIVIFEGLNRAALEIQYEALDMIENKKIVCHSRFSSDVATWELPKNSRLIPIVYENELEKKLDNNVIAFLDNFAHIYIDQSVIEKLPSDDTITLPSNIHPSIYAYILYKKFVGNDVLSGGFDNGKTNISLAKWEMASNVLYKTNKVRILETVIGSELTEDFISFCSTPTISIDDIVNNNYEDIFAEQVDAKLLFNIVANLSYVDEENLENVREFVMGISIPELTDMFDKLWTCGDEKRVEILNRLNDNSKTK